VILDFLYNVIGFEHTTDCLNLREEMIKYRIKTRIPPKFSFNLLP
jgi:hypothetical protein